MVIQIAVSPQLCTGLFTTTHDPGLAASRSTTAISSAVQRGGKVGPLGLAFNGWHRAARSLSCASLTETTSPVVMLSPPVSVQLTPAQLAWLDARRQRGAISRSAALRQALDDLMTMAPTAPSKQEHHA